MNPPIIVDRRTSSKSSEAPPASKVIDILEWAKSKATSDARASRYLQRLAEAGR